MIQLYKGNPTTSISPPTIPPFQSPLGGSSKGKSYIASEALARAVNVAIAIGQPLLLTGEPGTGKTQLAYSVARELGLELFVFYTKTTSVATDLFYHYDSIGHFRAAQTQQHDSKTAQANDFISLDALGKAILLSKDAQRRSVVLIDEIDKAPRDFPNDLLNELENFQFSIKELSANNRYEADQAYRPIVILTSNSEKGLPDAFLRRCTYYHIPFPDRKQLQRIVEAHLKDIDPVWYNPAIDFFERLRSIGMKKPPATAEMLNWIYVLKQLNIQFPNPDKSLLAFALPVLAKNEEDLRQLNVEITKI